MKKILEKCFKLLGYIMICFFIICVSGIGFLWWYTEGRPVIIPTVGDIEECQAIMMKIRIFCTEGTGNHVLHAGCTPSLLTSSITIYQITDPIKQDSLIDLLKEFKIENQTRPMMVYFYDGLRPYEKTTQLEDGSAILVRGSEKGLLLRKVWVK